ncbi:MAG: hypothetical protein HRF46_06835 [Acidobacteriota bacterium]|jgi:glutaredoxin
MITVFVVAECPHCAALIADLERRHVGYRCVDLRRESGRLEELKRLTWERRLPVVVDHERCSVGFCGGSSTWLELGLEG